MENVIKVRGAKIKIAPFVPNCLMGVVEAVAKFKYDIQSLDKLYFSHTFEYEEKTNGYMDENNVLNFRLFRQLPLDKKEFTQRLFYYYGIKLLSKSYKRFEILQKDIEFFIKNDEPILIEIDLYFAQKHRMYHKVHNMHMMIIYGINAKEGTYLVCESIFGNYEFPLSDLRDYFCSVRNNNREFYLLTVDGSPGIKNIISKKKLLDDLNSTLDNLGANDNHYGIKALQQYTSKFYKFYEWNKKWKQQVYFMPGIWSFTCDAMNCFKFMNQVENDLLYLKTNVLSEIKKRFTLLNRKWFLIVFNMEESQNKHDFSKTDRAVQDFKDICILEKELYSLLSDFRLQIEDAEIISM